VALGVTNASFVAQTAEWVPAHLYATLRAARQHRGLSFVRILQRCPIYSSAIFLSAVQDPANINLLVHDDGVMVPELGKLYKNQMAHDLHDIDAARRVAGATDRLNLGVLYRDDTKPRYEDMRRVLPRTAAERVALIDAELDRYAV
jgi:2-oxoglutarate ferredoxin oxidoreductase subunit beta